MHSQSSPPVVPPVAPPVAEVLTIGDELCRGEIIDTNSGWLAARLTELGFHVRWRSSTTDDPADMAAALRLAASRAQVVLCSGGLGPTEDDRTVDVVATLCGVEPAVDAAHEERMVRRFAERGFAATPNNQRQVRVPGGAAVLANATGLAPGFAVRLGGAEVYCTPGFPREMKPMFDQAIEPRLRAWLREAGHEAPALGRRTWRVTGLGESHIDHRLRGLLDGIVGATLHFRVAYPDILVSVVVRRPGADEAEAVLAGLDGEVRSRLGEHVYGTGEDTLAVVVGRRLRVLGLKLATAESCTGGLVGDLLTDVPGASDYYLGGVVSYSNELKMALLGVRAETLREHGAVSEACVREMAEGVRSRLGADWGLAISGIAGPGGGTPEKPVGTVHFAVAGPPSGDRPNTVARRLVWPTERRMVKQLAAQAALFLLFRQLPLQP